MKLEVFTLCDAATGDLNGKLNLLGAFDTLFAQSEPITHPACSVALRMRFGKNDVGTQPLELKLLDGDNKPVLPPMRTNLTVTLPEGMPTMSQNFVLNIQQMKLPHFGEYRIELIYGNQPAGWIPLYVRPAPTQ